MTNDIEQIRKRLEAATPGPWRFDSFNDIEDNMGRILFRILDHPMDEVYPTGGQERGDWYSESERNVDFVVNAPADIRFLLEQLEATQKQLADALKVTTKNTIEHVGKPK
jgi:hypothetical protein